MMTTLEGVGLVASVIAIFEAGYVIGVLRTNKRRRASEDDLIANRVRQVLGAIRIKEVECDATELFTGQTIPMSLIIASDAASPIEAWIGVTLP
ncbi:MAG: hypothetical protein ACKVQW_07140 [Pyrinomonadaceae bacterium]